MSPRLSLLRALRPPPGLGRVLRALGVGGVPAGGYFGAGWSLGTLLLLYWIETILVTLVVAILVVRHRRVTRKAGHWNAGTVVTTSRGKSSRSRKATLLGSFLGVMVPFTAAHGIFVAVFVFLVFPQELGPAAQVSSAALAGGLVAIGAFLLAGLLFDLWGIADRPFSWVERMTQRAQGRMVVTHLTIIFGAAAMAAFDAALGFLVVFVVLKSLLDLGGLLPDRGSEGESEGEEVPRFVRALGRRLPKKEGRSFSEHYAAEIAAQREQSEENERSRPPRD